MTLRRLLAHQTLRGPVLGFVDGIINALTLAAHSIVGTGPPMTFHLAVRIALFAFGTGCLVLFVSGYVDLRNELVRATRQLNLRRNNNLAITHLGRAVLRESGIDAGAGGIASFLGCLLPLTVANLDPARSWLGIVAALVMLAILGAALALSVGGRWPVWAATLALAGGALTGIGLWLRIV